MPRRSKDQKQTKPETDNVLLTLVKPFWDIYRQAEGVRVHVGIEAANAELFRIIESYSVVWDVDIKSSQVRRGSIDNLTQPVLLELVKNISDARANYAINNPQYEQYLAKVVALIMPGFSQCFENTKPNQEQEQDQEEPSLWASLTSLFSSDQPKTLTFDQAARDMIDKDPAIVQNFRTWLQKIDREGQARVSLPSKQEPRPNPPPPPKPSHSHPVPPQRPFHTQAGKYAPPPPQRANYTKSGHYAPPPPPRLTGDVTSRTVPQPTPAPPSYQNPLTHSGVTKAGKVPPPPREKKVPKPPPGRKPVTRASSALAAGKASEGQVTTHRRAPPPPRHERKIPAPPPRRTMVTRSSPALSVLSQTSEGAAEKPLKRKAPSKTPGSVEGSNQSMGPAMSELAMALAKRREKATTGKRKTTAASSSSSTMYGRSNDGAHKKRRLRSSSESSAAEMQTHSSVTPGAPS